MTPRTYEMNPVEAITAGAIGEPGQRVFYIQARDADQTVTLLTEKMQVQLLAHGVYQLLAEVEEKYPAMPPANEAGSFNMELHPPLEPEFRVDRMELAYDPARDLVILVCHELVEEDTGEVEQSPSAAPSVARLYATRAQMRALADHALEVIARGRPVCALCGQPYDAQGHVCPRRNGHPPT